MKKGIFQTTGTTDIKTDGKRTLLTLEKRLELAARSQAVSPESAAALVKRLSEIHTADLFCGNANLNRMDGLTGEFLDRIGDELFCYRGFCQSFPMAIAHDTDILEQLQEETPEDMVKALSCLPIYGARVNNALILLAELLLEHAKGQMRCESIYHCMRMTLEQYLDALVDLSFRKDGTLNRGQVKFYQTWRDTLLRAYDGSQPLEKTLAEILRRYIASWQTFGDLEYILCHAEDPNCPDPRNVPDPGSPDLAPGTLRSQIFLLRQDYRPGTLKTLAAQSSCTDLQAFLEQNDTEERLAQAMNRLNTAVADLYTLWVAPYLSMDWYHYERHLENDAYSA